MALICCLLLLCACGGGEGSVPVTLREAKVENDKLVFIMSDGSKISAGTLPANKEGIKFNTASISENGLTVTFTDGWQKIFKDFPDFNEEYRLTSAQITSDWNLKLGTNWGEENLGKIFFPTMPLSAMTPSGASEYAESRDVTGRNTAIVEMDIRGYGKITLLLDATSAPITVKNFLTLAKSGFYNGLTFHRLVENFMIQGGDPLGNGAGNSGSTIYGEFSTNGYDGNDILHKRGTISMARGQTNDSASSQFFICTSDYNYGNGRYAAFGYVLSGMNIVDEISRLGIVYADYQSGIVRDKNKQIVITSVTVIDDIDWGEAEQPGEGDLGGSEDSGEQGGSGSDGGEGSSANGGLDPDTDEGGWSKP